MGIFRKTSSGKEKPPFEKPEDKQLNNATDIRRILEGKEYEKNHPEIFTDFSDIKEREAFLYQISQMKKATFDENLNEKEKNLKHERYGLKSREEEIKNLKETPIRDAEEKHLFNLLRYIDRQLEVIKEEKEIIKQKSTLK